MSIGASEQNPGQQQRELIFRTFAPGYIELGIPVFPVSLDKKPRISHAQLIGCRASSELADRGEFADANIGMWCGSRWGITIVDVDEPGEAPLNAALDWFGETPLIARTHSDNHHLYFRFNGERRRIRLHGAPIDILGSGVGILPPSVGRKGEYQFVRGGIGELRLRRELPTIKPGAIPPLQTALGTSSCPTENSSQPETDIGSRDIRLFSACRHCAAAANTLDEVEAFALAMNQAFSPPLAEHEARRKARQAWKYKLEGRLMLPGRPAVILFDPLELNEFRSKPRHLQLLLEIRAAHGAEPNKIFALGMKALAKRHSCGVCAIRAAIEGLITTRKIQRVYKGGQGKGDPSGYCIIR